MLPKLHRLTKARDFNNIHQKGKFVGLSFGRQGEKFLAIKFLKNNLSVSRFGILVGEKVSKKATERNKVKRRIREVLRLKLKQIKPGFDVIVFTKKEIVAKTYQEIDEAVDRIFRKAGLFHKNTRVK